MDFLTKEVSVIIVSWNACELLRGCLNSIRELRCPTIREIILVDNASCDGSPEMAVEEFPEVTLIRSKENLGFARANNLGMTHASGSYLALVNSDVIVHPYCFQRLVEFLENHSDVGMVGPKVFGVDGHLQRTCRLLPTIWNTTCRALGIDTILSRFSFFSGREIRHWSHDSQADVQVLSGCFLLVRRAAVDKVGGLDERFFFYAEDVDWCKRFADAGWRIAYVPEATSTHLGGGSSSNASTRFSIEILRANLAYWKKHRGYLGLWACYLLFLVHHVLRFTARGILGMFSVANQDAGSRALNEHFVCLRWLITGKSF